VAARFKRTKSGIELRLDAFEAALLRSLATQVRELVAPVEPADADPLELITGLTSGPPPMHPDDAVLARLLPDGLGGPGVELDTEGRKAAGEFRRLTEYDLRASKVADADAVLAATPADGGRIVLDTGTAECWVRAFTDIRLALGTRLGLTEDNAREFERRPHDDPVRQLFGVYGWLTQLQETLVDALVD
jgi:hypothetical protein